MKSFFSKTRLFVGIVLSLTICMMFVGCSNSTSAPASEACRDGMPVSSEKTGSTYQH